MSPRYPIKRCTAALQGPGPPCCYGVMGLKGWLVTLSPGEQRGLMCRGLWGLLPQKARSLEVALLTPAPTRMMGK